MKKEKEKVKPHPVFWKLTAAFQDFNIVKRNAEEAVVTAQNRVRSVMLEAGLDPVKNYSLNPDTETIDLVEDPKTD